MRRFVCVTAGCAAALGLAAIADADVLAQYTFTGVSDSNPAPSADANTGSNASTFTAGTGFGVGALFTSGSAGNPAPSRGVFSQFVANSAADAITGNDYYQFTLTPVGDNQITYANLTFDIAARRANANVASNTATFFVRSNANGDNNFATTLGSPASTDAVVSTGAVTFSPVNIDLASLGTISSPVTFRIYVHDLIDSSDANNLIDNVVLNGTVIPEPASLALFGLGGLLIAARRRVSA